MTAAQTSPHATYVAHLEKGELAYQFSPEAGTRGVLSAARVPVHRHRRKLEWRIGKGLGTVHATTVVHPVEGKPFNVALIDCDEGFRLMSRVEDIAPDAGADRPARALPRASARRRRASRCRCSCRPATRLLRQRAAATPADQAERPTGLEARQRGDRRRRRIRSRPGRRRA